MSDIISPVTHTDDLTCQGLAKHADDIVPCSKSIQGLFTTMKIHIKTMDNKYT